VEHAAAKYRRCKLPGSDRILAEPIQVGGEGLCSESHKHIIYMWNKEELPDQWKEPIIIQIYKKGEKTD
jgi:hypothetical protein